jgi:hypothetical protein
MTRYEQLVRMREEVTNSCILFPYSLAGTCKCKPQVSINGKAYYAARVSLELKLGRPLDTQMEACHICDNSKCINPSHLYEGTHQDNMNDRAERSINRKQLLTEQDAKDFHWLKSLKVPQRTVASWFNISPQAVNDIIKCRHFTRVCKELINV